jgi:epoxyqueuosine reductase
VSESGSEGEGERAGRVHAAARALGFDAVGIAPADPPAHAGFLREWLARGYAGEMAWLARRAAEREDPRRVLPGARSIVAVAVVYDTGSDDGSMRARPGPVRGGTQPCEGAGRIARYAGGADYHEVLGRRLRALASAIAALAPGTRTRHYVDTGPVLERPIAARAGLGWIGKHTLLIHPRLGSYLFLGVVLTDLALAPDAPEPDHCGSCRACLDACPTGAFPEPFVLDASRCLSYTTIELRSAIPEPLREPQGDWVFGCDVCQQVCPWNTRPRRSVPEDAGGMRAELAPRAPWRRPALATLLELDERAWAELARGTALRRAKWRGLLRNALVAAGNSGDATLVPSLRRHAAADDPLFAEHARWALAQLADPETRGNGDVH